jgi:hypothetical protein
MDITLSNPAVRLSVDALQYIKDFSEEVIIVLGGILPQITRVYDAEFTLFVEGETTATEDEVDAFVTRVFPNSFFHSTNVT